MGAIHHNGALLLILLAWCSGDASTSSVTPRLFEAREGIAAFPDAGASRHPGALTAHGKEHSAGPSPLALRVSGGGEFFDSELAIKQLYASLEITEEGRRGLAALEQGTDEWLDARRNRLTGSNFGAAAGHNKYKSPEGLAHDMLYGTFKGNEATRWGTAHEPVACDEYIIARRAKLTETHGDNFVFEVTHSGLNVDVERPWLAVSPDGHVREGEVDAVLEIKCPFSKRPYPSIPPYYMDQLQGLMGVLGSPWGDFFVWTPNSFSSTRVPFNEKYWKEELLPALEAFYKDVFIPAYLDKLRRAAQGDDSVPPCPR